ncbi:MAG: UDP-glucose 4-epimerase GalE [Rubellimicrobium sp.]|nr:UDP-glucose 4-epimerase GalE [Rubellimicrobium sp.]
MSKIIVFGGAGFIGSHTCKELHRNGFEPVAFDNLVEGQPGCVRWGDLIKGDICNRDDVAAALSRIRPVAAIHFAAHAYVGHSVRDPATYYRNNVTGSLNLAEALLEAGPVPLIFSSTCATYGDPGSRPITEDLPQVPINPYGRSKLMFEQILRDFSRAYGLRSVALRYFNAAGADPEGEIGEAHREETHLIPRAILAALGRIEDFQVFGADFATPDGSAVRDYIHVSDLARAHVAACRYLLGGGETDQFNLGAGRGFSVFEIIAAVERVLGRPVPHSIAPRRAGDPPVLVADASKARDVLGFAPELSDLDDIIRSAAAWFARRAGAGAAVRAAVV